jgi:hypothetical protein
MRKNMKNKLAILLLAFLTLASPTFAQTNLLTGSVGNYGLAPQTGIACTLTLVSPNPRTVNGVFIRRDPVVATSDTNGAFYFTNVVWGNYTLTFAGRVDTVFKMAVLTNTEGDVPMASLATSATVAMPNPATNFYTMSQVDALVAGAGGGTSGALTNGDVRAVSLVSNLTVGGLITGNGAGLTNVGTSGALTNGDVRDITFAGAVYGQDAAATNGFTTLAQLNSATNLLTGPSPSNSNLLYSARYATASTNTAQSIPWAPFTNSSVSWGSSGTNLEWLSTGTRFRIRQSTPVSQARFLYVSSPLLNTNLYELRFKIWRTNTTAAGTFTLIDTSADVHSQVTVSGTNTVTFTPPLNCQVGDYVGVFASWTNSNYNPFKFDTRGFQSAGTWMHNDGTGFTGSKQWSTETFFTNYVPLVELYATNSPVVVFLGDSIIGNLQADTAASNIIPDIVSTNLGLIWQNMGVGGQQVQEFTARITNDVFNANPRMIILEGGVNNLIAGNANATIQGYFGALWTTISDRSIPFVQCAIFPTSGWVDPTNRALLNNWISNNVASYGGVYWDAAPYIGSNSPTGPAGNLWYPLPGTTIDNLHFNAAGCWIIGTNLVNFINSLPPVSTGTLATRTELIAVSNALANAASPNALTNSDTRAITFANNLTVNGTNSAGVLEIVGVNSPVILTAGSDNELVVGSEIAVQGSGVIAGNLRVGFTITGNGAGITNTSGYSLGSMADTNWVLSQIASLGAHVYATGTTNTQGVLTLTNKSQGWAAVPTTVTTNTVSAAAGQYVRSIVSSNTFARFEAGPISIEAYAFRVGAAATSVSFHPEIYIYDPILSNLVEVAAAPSQVCQSNVPVLFDFSVSLPSSFVPTNASHIVWAWKVDGTNGTPTSLNFVSGGAYDSHLSFSVPAASGFTLPRTVPLTNMDNAFYGSNTFNGITYFKEIRSAYPGGNISIGSNAAQVASAGIVTVAIGSSALSKNTNGSYNVAIGAGAVQNATNITGTVAIGYQAQNVLQSGTENTAVGYQAQKSVIVGIANTAVGSYAQEYLDGTDNTALGAYAQRNTTTGVANTAVGTSAQYSSQTGSYNTSIGRGAHYKMTGSNNVAVGYSTAYYETGGAYNTVMGTLAAQDKTNGSYNVVVGASALLSATNITGTVAIGYQAQNVLQLSTQNTALGYQSQTYLITGSGNTSVGYRSADGANAADNAASLIDTNCTFIGTSSGRSSTIPNTTPLTNATSIGYNSKAIANNTVTLGGTGKEAVALVLNPMGSQPTNIPPNFAYFYSITNSTNAVVEMYISGGDGVATQISPHADDAPPQLYDKTTGDMKEIIWRESNPYITNGLVSFINMRRMARLTELNTRAILYLAGNTAVGPSNGLVKLKALQPWERSVIATEDYQTYNARTGGNLQPLNWDTMQASVQATYDMQRANIDLQRTYLSATNAVIQAQIAAGDTNLTLVPLPDALPVRNVKQAKPGWMQ